MMKQQLSARSDELSRVVSGVCVYRTVGLSATIEEDLKRNTRISYGVWVGSKRTWEGCQEKCQRYEAGGIQSTGAASAVEQIGTGTKGKRARRAS